MTSPPGRAVPKTLEAQQAFQAPQSPQNQTDADEQRRQARKLAWQKIQKYCKLLNLDYNIMAKAYSVHRVAYDEHLIHKRGLRSILAVCVFLACRSKDVYMEFATVVGKIQSPVAETIELLWLLEGCLAGCHFEIPNVTWTPSKRSWAFSVSGEPTMEARLWWAIDLFTGRYHVEIVLMNNFNTKCPCLSDIRFGKYHGLWEKRHENGYFREVRRPLKNAAGEPESRYIKEIKESAANAIIGTDQEVEGKSREGNADIRNQEDVPKRQASKEPSIKEELRQPNEGPAEENANADTYDMIVESRATEGPQPAEKKADEEPDEDSDTESDEDSDEEIRELVKESRALRLEIKEEQRKFDEGQKADDNDWDIVESEEAQDGKKAVKSKGWVGVLRHGLSG